MVAVLLCKSPYMRGLLACGCGQCTPCRLNRRRLWTSRLMLEAMAHTNNAFVTLTYDQERFPPGGSVNPDHVQDWLKRLRFEIAPTRIRYYLVGEYGDSTFRPHYHVALFGLPTCVRGRTEHRLSSCCGPCDLVRNTWGFGGVDLGELTMQSSAYIAGYVTKKMTKADDPRLEGRAPEFARMSLRPGIGALSIPEIAKTVQDSMYEDTLKAEGDVPVSLNRGRRSMPLGRYLRRKLREEIGRSADTPECVVGRVVSEMSKLYEEAREEAKMGGTPEAFLDKKGIYHYLNAQKIRNLEARSKIFESQRSL